MTPPKTSDCNESAPASFAGAHGSAAFQPRKSWVLVSPTNRVIHLSDNRKMLQALKRADDRIERAVISPLAEGPPKAHLETDGRSRISEEGSPHCQRPNDQAHLRQPDHDSRKETKMNEPQETQPKPEAGLPLGAAPCSAIPAIQSAVLNIGTAMSDCESARDAWIEENWNDATMWISNAIAQLESAKAKIYAHQEAESPNIVMTDKKAV